MIKTTKKLWMVTCLFVAMICVSVGGVFTLLQTTHAQADDTVVAEFTDFEVEGVGAIHNHFYSDIGLFYQLTLDFSQEGLAFNQHASAVSGITFNGVPMTCGGAPSGDSIMVITLNRGLWIHYTAEQAVSGYKGYSHATIQFTEGATVTDASGVTMTYAELTLYLVNGEWTTTQPEDYGIIDTVNYAPNFVSIGGVNHMYNDILVSYGLSLIYDTTGFAIEGAQVVASSATGFSLNGEEIGVALWGGNQLLFWLPANKCESNYNGYSHPTLAILDGAKVTNEAGKEFTFGGITLYLVDGAWTTTRPDGYAVELSKATFVDFLVEGVGGIRNNFYNEHFYEVTLDFDQGGLAFNQHASEVLGITFNGIPMTCGDAPSGDSIMVITLNSGLWIHYTAEQSVSGYKGYSHPTIHFEDGATVTDSNCVTMPYNELTLYLVDGEWTATQPDGYSVEEPKATFVDFLVEGVGGIRNNFYNGNFYEVSLDFDQGGLAFNQHASEVLGITFNGIPMTCGGAPNGDAIMVITLGNGLWIHYTAEQAEPYYNRYSHATIFFENGATVTDANGETKTYAELTLYLVNGEWTLEQPDGYEIKEPEPLPDPLPYNGIAPKWNNFIFDGVSNTILCFGEYIRDEENELIKCDFLGPDNGAEGRADHTNWANPVLNAPIATALTINGKAIAELYALDNKVQVSYAHGYNYFFIAIPEYMLVPDGYGCTALHIEEKTAFLDCVLPEVTLYFYEGEWTSIKPDVVESEETEYTTVSEMFGEEIKNFSDSASIESALVANGSAVYSFLLKNDSIANTIIFSTHYTTEFDGIKVVFMGDSTTGRENVLLFVNGREIAVASYTWTESEWFTVKIAVDVEETLSVSVAIDGVYYIKATDVAKDELGTKIGVQNEKGNNAIADYKVGDIKNPILYWQGDAEYLYEVNTAKPEDSVFKALVAVTDNKDGVMDASSVQVLWQDGAITDGKLNEGTWFVALSISDSAGNIAQYKITIVVEDSTKVTVTFDGVPMETVYHIGDLLVEPVAPTKQGYVFEGWYVGDMKWDFANDVVSGNLSLTSKYSKATYTVVLTSEGLEENYTNTFELEYGETLNQTTLVRDGYTYELYVGDIKVQSVIVENDINVKVVYTKKENGPTDSSDSSSSSSDMTDNSENSESNYQTDTTDSTNSGCFGAVSYSGIGLTLLFISAITLLKKKQKN